MVVPEPPDGSAFEGFTLRLFDPSAGTWLDGGSSWRANRLMRLSRAQ